MQVFPCLQVCYKLLRKQKRSLFLIFKYVMISPLTEILSVKDAGSFVGLRNSLKITRIQQNGFCMDSLVEHLFFSYTDFR